MKKIARSFLVMIAVQCVLCVALVVSLSWNIHQARERSAAVDESYLAGRIDGINWSRAVIARVGQMIEEAARQEQEREAADHIAEEKL